MRTGFTDYNMYSLDWKIFAWYISQKKFLASKFAYSLCSPLHMRASVSSPGPVWYKDELLFQAVGKFYKY